MTTTGTPWWQSQWAQSIFEKLVLGVIVFLATSAANLWFDQQKAATALRLTDSNLITVSASALWKEVALLQSQYSELHEVKKKQRFANSVFNESGREYDTDIQQSTEKLRTSKDALSRRICAEEHVIGEPMVRHLLQYLLVLDGYYESEAKTLDATHPEAQKFNRALAKGLAHALREMRLDVVATRDYALRQVGR